MFIDPHHIHKAFLKCNEIIDIPVLFSFGDAENAQGELCPNPVRIHNIKGFIGVSPGFTISSANFSNGVFSDPILEVGSMVSDEELQGNIKIDVGDTCNIPGYVTIKWRGYDEDGEICLEHIVNYHITADNTCCIVKECINLNTELKCKPGSNNKIEEDCGITAG